MRFPEVSHPSVDSELAWYAKRPEYIQRTTDRARLYLGHIVHEAKRRNLPLELTLLPVVESAFQPYGTLALPALWASGNSFARPVATTALNRPLGRTRGATYRSGHPRRL